MSRFIKTRLPRSNLGPKPCRNNRSRVPRGHEMPLGAYPNCTRLASMELSMGVHEGERILPLVLMKSSWGCRGSLKAPLTGGATARRCWCGREYGKRQCQRDATGERQRLPCQDRGCSTTDILQSLRTYFLRL
jgi:hypothetical protein